MEKKEIKVILADDHELIIQGISGLIQGTDHIKVIGTACNGKKLIELLESVVPDVILLDVEMPEMDGIEAAEIIKVNYPEIKIIALTVFNEIGIITALKKAGIHGYLLKNVSKDELLLAIKTVFEGKSFYSGEVTDNLLKNLTIKCKNIPENLTERELEILCLIAEGFSNSAIGDKLFISHRTVDTHRTNLMKKLGVNNIAGLVKFAIQNGLVE